MVVARPQTSDLQNQKSYELAIYLAALALDVNITYRRFMRDDPKLAVERVVRD